EYSAARRLPYYFFLFVLQGSVKYSVDMETITVGKHELMFSVPNQLQAFPAGSHGKNYFKLGFDDDCLSRLPSKYPFLLNHLHQQKISFTPAAANRLRGVFGSLLELLSDADSNPELILAYVNTLLTEIDSGYSQSEKRPAGEELEKFLGFKLFVETNLSRQPAIPEIAGQLAMSTDSLYRIVKRYSGRSPKKFITDRLILEARRLVHSGHSKSVKELAYELGFSDPGYFSRLFKKVTGKTVAAACQDLSL
ncbi:MAG: AraC family transcriptional regulator, partial [Chitinophagaceae bacterium]